MIRSVASLARRVAGSPGRLARGLAVLAVLAAAICGATPSEARPAGRACAAGALAATAITAAASAQARAADVDVASLDRPGICAGDFEGGPADLGLAPTDAPRRALGAVASFRSISDEILASAPGGSPLRPPRGA